ncbi:MAG: hypothetical protein ABIW57_03785 [Polyangia bacterium]
MIAAPSPHPAATPPTWLVNGVRVRLATVVLTGLVVSPPAWPAAPVAVEGRAAPAAFAPFLSADTDLVLLPAARRPPARPVVVAATRVAARANEVATVFLTPALLRQALPALVRAEVIATRPGPRPEGWPDRLLAWEVEVPLFNLKGKAWLQQRPDGAELTLVEGAFAPGNIRFRVAPAGNNSAAAAVLTTELQLEVRSSNWIFRKVARHDPWAETAMTAAMGWVVTRAVGLRAEAPPGAAPARPRVPIQPPAATALDGTPLAGPALAALRGTGLLASVRRATNGRLAWTSVATPVPTTGAADSAAGRLAVPENWLVFPGWKSVKRRPAPAAGAGGRSALLIEVKDDVSLVDLDAVWAVEPGLPVRATVVDGETRGGVLAWQILSQGRSKDESPGSTSADSATGLAVLSMHPRLDAAGFIERRLVAAEPLLEHALALALTYVDAAAMADDLAAHDRGATPRQTGQRQTPTPEQPK